MSCIQALSPTNEQVQALQNVQPFAEVFEANIDGHKHELLKLKTRKMEQEFYQSCIH